MHTLGPALLGRFESDRGYRSFPETLQCRKFTIGIVQPTNQLIYSGQSEKARRENIHSVQRRSENLSVQSSLSHPHPCQAEREIDLAVHTLRSLGILDRITHLPTLSWDIEYSKPQSEIFQAACQACDEELGQGVLMVGDELKA